MDLESILQNLTELDPAYIRVFLASMRYAAPVLAAVLLLRCLLPLVTFRREPEIWGWLQVGDNRAHPLTHWENVIGRSKSSDIVVDFPTVSRNHAVLTRYDDGSWTITDTGSKSGTLVNGQAISIHALRRGNVVGIHEVHIHTPNQSLTLKHESGSRAMLADGAVSAARFMLGKEKGLYDMESILNAM